LFAAVTVLVGLLLASTAMADSPPPPQPKTFCIEVYQPVCGTKAGKRMTYSNSCFAKADGATDISEGPCGPGDDSPIHR
ncbi:MAG TPA: hypothetical protein VN808_20545, partial [Stellaceae bacterium]|nr:hypothetical protein [Stellaceae bacterium]